MLSVSYPRDGGVLGFFARQRVGVHYELDADGPSGAPADFSRDFAAALGQHSAGDDIAPSTAIIDPFDELIKRPRQPKQPPPATASHPPAGVDTGRPQ